MAKENKEGQNNKKTTFMEFISSMFMLIFILGIVIAITGYTIYVTLPIIEYVLPIVASIFIILYLIWNYTNK